jgi:hypothetical protein
MAGAVLHDHVMQAKVDLLAVVELEPDLALSTMP